MNNRGITANRVKNPMIIKSEQMISEYTSQVAQNTAGLIPNLADLPLPRTSGDKNF